MGNRTYKRAFKDKTILKEMLDRYLAGASLDGLAREYSVDRSSIRFHVGKHGLLRPFSIAWTRKHRKYPDEFYFPKSGRPNYPALIRAGIIAPLSAPEILHQVPHVYKYQHLLEERTRSPKTYAEIYAAALKRGDRSLRYASKPPSPYERNRIVSNDIHT